jgi:hypothetical protein
MSTHQGGCHCGAIRFEVTGEIEDLAVCNCSICSKTAYIHWHVEPECFTLQTSPDAIRNYKFGTMTSDNQFCVTCGISPFRRSRTTPDLIDINVRCVDGVDAEALPVEHFDGQNWEEAVKRE